VTVSPSYFIDIFSAIVGKPMLDIDVLTIAEKHVSFAKIMTDVSRNHFAIQLFEKESDQFPIAQLHLTINQAPAFGNGVPANVNGAVNGAPADVNGAFNGAPADVRGAVNGCVNGAAVVRGAVNATPAVKGDVYIFKTYQWGRFNRIFRLLPLQNTKISHIESWLRMYCDNTYCGNCYQFCNDFGIRYSRSYFRTKLGIATLYLVCLFLLWKYEREWRRFVYFMWLISNLKEWNHLSFTFLIALWEGNINRYGYPQCPRFIQFHGRHIGIEAADLDSCPCRHATINGRI
jgi:hypothetical protein